MKKKGIREKVIKILEKHPEGLTTVEISKEIGMSRHTIAKYVYQLLGEGLIFQREVGTAKICYLKGKKHGRKSL
jgi:predicted transcriptional regulator